MLLWIVLFWPIRSSHANALLASHRACTLRTWFAKISTSVRGTIQRSSRTGNCERVLRNAWTYPARIMRYVIRDFIGIIPQKCAGKVIPAAGVELTIVTRIPGHLATRGTNMITITIVHAKHHFPARAWRALVVVRYFKSHEICLLLSVNNILK